MTALLGLPQLTLKNALATSKTALLKGITTYKTDLTAQLSADSKEMTDQLATVEREVKEWVPKFIKIVKRAVILPILATALACLVMIGGSVAWWKIQDRNHVHMSPFTGDKGEKMMVVDEPTWAKCSDQPITDKAGKKVIYQRPCKEVKP